MQKLFSFHTPPKVRPPRLLADTLEGAAVVPLKAYVPAPFRMECTPMILSLTPSSSS